MRGFRKVMTGAAMSALAIGALGVPAAGAVPKAYVAIVQGMPGKVVDVCFGDKEVRSGLRYGGTTAKVVKPDSYAIKFRAAQPGTCTGSLLASRAMTLSPQEDLTIVATAKAPIRVVVFDNTGLGLLECTPGCLPSLAGAFFAWRSAADVGGITFKRMDDQFMFTPPAPAAEPVWQKGDESTNVYGLSSSDGYYLLMATMAGTRKPIAGPIATKIQIDRRYEWLLVGTTQRNAKLATIVRPISWPL